MQHGHLVLDDDFLAADRLRDAGQRVAHQGDDGDLHVGLSQLCWAEMKLPEHGATVPSLCGRCLNKSQPHRHH